MSSSLLWPHFSKADNGETASCNICNKHFKTKVGNTSSLRKHLQAVHKKEYDEVHKAEENRKLKKNEEAVKRKLQDETDTVKENQPKTLMHLATDSSSTVHPVRSS